jgi:hypothetical protein
MSVEATMAYDWNVFGESFRDRTNDLRAGVLSIAYGGAEYGISSEGIRHATQNVAIHDHFLDWFGEPSPWFNGLPSQFPPWGHYQLGAPGLLRYGEIPPTRVPYGGMRLCDWSMPHRATASVRGVQTW